MPSLFVVATNDPFVSIKDTQALVSSVAAKTKRLVVVPASGEHGWDLLDDSASPPPSRSPSDDVVAFLTAVLS